MPIYEFNCACGLVVDKRRKADDRDDPLACVECGADMRRGVGSMIMIGAGFDKKIEFGRHSFGTNAAYRKWQNDNPEAEVITKESREGKQAVWEAKQEAHKYAKEEGFDDEAHMRKTNRKQNSDHMKIRNMETPKYFGSATSPITGKV